MRLSHVHIGVSNLSKSEAFYGKLLGLPVRSIGPGMASVSFQNGSLDLDELKKPIPGSRRAFLSQVVIAFSVPNLQRYYQRIRRRGVKTLDKPTKRPWGAYNFYLLDVDGYKLEIEQEAR